MSAKHTVKRSTSAELFEISKTYFPGGVNSPVRAFKSVEGTPLFIKKGDGCRIWDEDDNEFIDFCCSWGPLILGHNHPAVYSKIVGALQNGGQPVLVSALLGAWQVVPSVDAQQVVACCARVG